MLDVSLKSTSLSRNDTSVSVSDHCTPCQGQKAFSSYFFKFVFGAETEGAETAMSKKKGKGEVAACGLRKLRSLARELPGFKPEYWAGLRASILFVLTVRALVYF